MLLVFLLLQLMPPEAHAAVATAMGERYSWQAVRSEIEPTWEITVCLPKPQHRSEMTLYQVGPVETVADVRSFSFASDLSAAAFASAMLNAPIGDELPLAPGEEPSPSNQPSAVFEASPRTFGPVMVSASWSAANMLALARRGSDANVSIPDPGGNGNNGGVGTVPKSPGTPNGPGGANFLGVGSTIPEPTTIPLLAMAIPLIVRRRAKRQNLTK